MKILTILSMVLSFNAFATSGGCIVTTSPTATSGPQFTQCQQHIYQVACDGDSSCSWNVPQYYANYCAGTLMQEQPCPQGVQTIPFNPGAPVNPKFTCCKEGSSGGGNSEPTGQCCNRGGNIVPSMTPCPTAQNPNLCCNPAGNPVPPMQASVDQCSEQTPMAPNSKNPKRFRKRR